jgi:hypothetical protein
MMAMKRINGFWFSVLGLLLLSVLEMPAWSGMMELSGTFSFSQSNYGNNNYAWSRRWGASLGYYFFALSEIEFSVQDILYRTRIGTEDTTFHDQVYSIDWVQSLAPKSSGFQPYLKVGVGQLNRESSGTDSFGNQLPVIYDALTVVGGAGLRIFILRTLAIKMEGTTYLLGGVLSTGKENFSINGGVSIYL